MKKLILLAMVFMGCKSQKAIVPSSTTTEVEKIVTVKERDTTFIVQADSSYYKAWIECVNNKPVLRNPSSQEGQTNLKAPQVNLGADGQLDVQCKTENMLLQAKIKELETELKTRKRETIPVEVERKLTFWQDLFIKLGKVFSGLLVGLVIYGALKIYSNVKK